MPCELVMIRNILTVTPTQTVDEIIDLLQEKHLRYLPVVDENNKLLGMVGSHHVLENLLPVSARMKKGLHTLDFVIGATMGVVSRLKKLKPKTAQEIMTTDIVVTHPDTPVWEVLRLIVAYGSPLCVVEKHSRKLVGMVSEQSCIENLMVIIEEMDEVSDDIEE